MQWTLAAGLQCLGWGVYGVMYFITLRPHNPFDDIVRQQAVVAAGSGLVLSSLLGWGYMRLRVGKCHPVRSGLAVLVGAGGVGWIWHRVNQWGADWVDPFEAPVLGYVALLPGQGSLLSSAEAFPVVLLIWSGFYLGIIYWYERHDQQQRLLQADAATQRARLQMLRYQLNPHFFFNALNMIGALADENPQRVKEAVRELSGFLRYSLLDGDVLEVPLNEEIRAVEHYLAVEKLRFEDDLQVRLDVTPAAGHRSVPAFLVLPLVENAVKHGQQTSPSPLRLRIVGTVSNERLMIEVANTGHLSDGQASAEGTGTGLSNVRARLRTQYPDHHRFTLVEENGWVRARIEIDVAAINPATRHA